MDPPTYTALAPASGASSSSSPSSSVSPASTVGTGERQVSAAAWSAPSSSSSSSAVSLLLAPLEGRSTFLSGRLLPPPPGLLDSPPGTVFWDARSRAADAHERGVPSASVSGELMTKGVQPGRVERLTVALNLVLRRKGQADEVLFERRVVVFPPPAPPALATAGSSSSSSSTSASAAAPNSSSASSSASFPTRPESSSSATAVGRPAFGGSRQVFAIPVPSTLPQCLHQPSLSLAYTLSAALTLRPAPASSPSSSSSPLPSEILTESMEIHLCPSGRPSSQAAPLIRSVPAPGRTPTPVLVGFPRTRCRKSEQVRLWVEIPIPDQRALERGVGLRNVRAELWRVVTVASAASSSGASASSSSAAALEEKGVRPRAAIPPSKVAQSPAGFGIGTSSISTLLTTTGSSCRFSPLSPIRLRLSVLAPLSPSSAYQLTCGHLTQQVAAAHETVDVRFWVKVMVGFVGAGVDEVECEQEVVVLGDLDDATEDDVKVNSQPALELSLHAGAEQEPEPELAAEDRPFSKERIFEGETFRQSDGAGPSASASSSSALPPGFVEALPSFSSDPPPPLAPSHDPPPFFEFPARAGAMDELEPPSPTGSSSRPPPFTPMAATIPPPPTFFEAVPQSTHTSPASVAAQASPSSPSYPLAPFLNIPPQVAPPTSPSADPANLPAEWLETDGYESFSLPPPPVSVGLETEGSVDPPAEGEGAVDRGRLERIYDSISPSALRRPASASTSPVAVTRVAMDAPRARAGSRVDDPNDLPPTFRDLALSSTTVASAAAAAAATNHDAPPPDFLQHFAHGPTSADAALPPHPSEVRSEQRRVAREQGGEVVPPPYAGDGVGSSRGVTREGDEGGEEPPRYS